MKRIAYMTLGGKFTYKLTSYLPVNCICAVILVIICTDTSRLWFDKHGPQQIDSFIVYYFQYYLVVKTNK